MGLYIYFGVPGSGKTTHAAKIVLDNLKHGIPTFSNVPIKGSFFVQSSDIGSVNISGGDLILDEASIEYNNRKFKSLSQSVIQWFKLYRHYGVRHIYVYSQSYEDMDITLRRLADRYFLIKRTLFPCLSLVRPIHVRIGIDEVSKQIIDEYRYDLLPSFLWLPRYWSMFDSWDAPVLPERDWACTGFGDVEPSSENRQLKQLYKTLRRRARNERFEKLRARFGFLFGHAVADVADENDLFFSAEFSPHHDVL